MIRSTGHRRRVTVALAGAAAIGMSGPAGPLTAHAEPASGAPAVHRLRDTRLDPQALYFVSFDGLVNNGSFQQSGILSYKGYQYAAWYTADRSAVIARRKLPDGAWQRLTLPHKLTINDSHNVISLGISPADDRIHAAMDTHGNPVFYTKSEPGLAAGRGQAWQAGRFGPIQRTLDGVDLTAITYPQFVVTPERRLQFSYRTGGSGNGTNELAEYDGGAWRKLGRWSSATGTYTSTNGQTSATRNMYIHGITYGPDGRLHAAYTWREGTTRVLCHPGGLTNHDTGYVYSDDRGRTWRNNAGQQVAATGTGDLVSIEDPGQVVDPLDPNHGLINQETQATDSTGQPHVIISYVPGRFTQCVTDFTAQRKAYSRAFHLTRDAAGAWRKVEIPVPNEAFGRAKLVFDKADNAYVVMPFGRIVGASKASGWRDWKLLFDGTFFGDGRTLNAFGELIVDDARVASDSVLSVMYQQKSTGTTPSRLRVIDFRLG